MASLAWVQKVAGSLSRNDKHVHSRFLQLATVTPEGRPSNRTVVFRGFENTDNLSFITDARSAKVQEIKSSPYAEVAWYFTETREQFRISGKLSVVGEETEDGALQALRQSKWQTISPNARLQFAWPSPSLPRDLSLPHSHNPPPPPEDAALPTFSLLLLHPESVDHLLLRENRRFVHTLLEGGGWGEEEVNP